MLGSYNLIVEEFLEIVLQKFLEEYHMNTFHNRTYKSQLYQGIMGRKFIFDVARVERQEDQTSTLHDCGMI